MSDTIQKVTIYKINELAIFDELAFSGYAKVSDGQIELNQKQLDYKLYFLNKFTKTPDWFDVFKGLNIAEEYKPLAQTTGFIMVVKLAESYYAFTGGIGHIRVREFLSIEPRFGIILAEKILSLPELKGLKQKDTAGVVNFMDRVFRSKYNPDGDIANLRRILTNIRGKLSEKNKHYEAIGKSIEAGNALTVNGAKKFNEILNFIMTVDDLWRNGAQSINIPQLHCIDKHFESQLIERLEEKLVQDICSLPNDDNSLFLDNEDMGYLPDRISKYELRLGRERRKCETYHDVFLESAKILNQINIAEEKMKTFRRLRLNVVFDDDIVEERELFYFICGDVVLNNEYYFINNRLWYQANNDYICKVNAEIDNVPFILPDTLELSEWNPTEHAGHNGEFKYNKSNSSYICLDHKLVSIDGESGQIEFCDLLREKNGTTKLIHVKRDSGAALRELFAQGFVSAQLYAEDNQFRNKVHTSDLKKEGDELTDTDKQVLSNLNAKYRNQFQIIYAIYDDTLSHRVPTNPQKTSDWLNGTLTTFAKVDLINRISSMRAMGYSVAITRIKPYPI